MPRAPALLRYLAGVSIVVALAILIGGWRAAHRDPVVRRVTLALPDWPRGAPPIRVALGSDIHAGGGAVPADRLVRMIDRIAATSPALVILAGDFVDGRAGRTARAAAPSLAAALRRLHPPLGTIAVLGNHDNDSDPAAVARAVRRC
ncbi:metallophosphoesterase [Sphingomonas sp. NBWT7]|uniref:metallophosphoesterase n=1 Tax=Sphingomonas sp. NBWT7 TaxID=2596913 RepID=UPI00215641E6|nr:metallophosphoesterase [Sphingomonas sp. NBWT7]